MHAQDAVCFRQWRSRHRALPWVASGGFSLGVHRLLYFSRCQVAPGQGGSFNNPFTSLAVRSWAAPSPRRVAARRRTAHFRASGRRACSHPFPRCRPRCQRGSPSPCVTVNSALFEVPRTLASDSLRLPNRRQDVATIESLLKGLNLVYKKCLGRGTILSVGEWGAGNSQNEPLGIRRLSS
jgi:hypothetical protein